MDTPVRKVRDFAAKYGFPLDQPLAAEPDLVMTANDVRYLADHTYPSDGLASCRSHLILEEVAELLEAFSLGDRVQTLDALADLAYVVLGTAAAYGLPLASAFDEVHRSNMTKTIIQDRPAHPGKGDGYSPPDLASILKLSDEDDLR